MLCYVVLRDGDRVDGRTYLLRVQCSVSSIHGVRSLLVVSTCIGSYEARIVACTSAVSTLGFGIGQRYCTPSLVALVTVPYPLYPKLGALASSRK